MKLDLPAHIFVPTVSSPAKIDRIRLYGAEPDRVGERYAEALAASIEFGKTSGAMPVHAFDQAETMIGPGTLGSSCSSRRRSWTRVLVAVGGGGLIGGIAAWYESKTRVIAVEPEGAPTLRSAEGRQAGGRADRQRRGGLARPETGRRADVPDRAGAHRAGRARHRRRDPDGAEDVVGSLRLVVEPGGCTAFAALLSGAYQPAEGERVGVVVSGANTTALPSATIEMNIFRAARRGRRLRW